MTITSRYASMPSGTRSEIQAPCVDFCPVLLPLQRIWEEMRPAVYHLLAGCLCLLRTAAEVRWATKINDWSSLQLTDRFTFTLKLVILEQGSVAHGKYLKSSLHNYPHVLSEFVEKLLNHELWLHNRYSDHLRISERNFFHIEPCSFFHTEVPPPWGTAGATVPQRDPKHQRPPAVDRDKLRR